MKSNYPIYFTLPVLSYFWYTFYKHLHDTMYMSMIDRVDFFIHEFGHIFFHVFWNELLWILGGTFMQVIIPLFIWFWFFLQRDYFAIAFSFLWIGTNFFYISMYSGDAIRLELPLIWAGWWGHIIHDWNYIFHHFGIILYTDMISLIFFVIAVFLHVIWFIFGAYLIINRWRY